MAESMVTGDSKEAVAYALLMGIALNEYKVGSFEGSLFVKADRNWVLTNYHACLRVVTGRAPG